MNEHLFFLLSIPAMAGVAYCFIGFITMCDAAIEEEIAERQRVTANARTRQK